MLDIILMVISVLIIILTLLQGGKSEGMSGAFTGGNSLNLFSNVKERGPEKALSLITLGLGVVFFIVVILENIL